MKRKHQGTAAGFPAATLPGIMTEQDREIAARREAGETRKAICEAFGVKVGRVYHAEYVCRRDAEGRAVLAECPDSIRGLEIIGELDSGAHHALAWHRHNHDGPSPERMSEVAALGRAYVSRMKGIGPKGLASIDRVLGLLGIAWSPIERTPQPKRPEPEPEHQPQPERSQFWNAIVRHVAEIERALGTAVLENCQGRDSREGVSYRLAFLTGYLESRAERESGRTRNMRDITPEPDAQDDGEYETAGNLICLPGVKLADVRPNDGGRA